MDRRSGLGLVVVVAVGAWFVAVERASLRVRRGDPSATLAADPARPVTLAEARRAHPTHLTRTINDGDPIDPPPTGVFDLVHYPAKPGPLAAYVTPDPKDGRRHPAIVWVHGGGCNSIGDAWHPAGRANDQTAAAYRKAGIVLMLPSLRGGNDNPGSVEKYFGEVDDVAAAGDYLAGLTWVDPHRIYLGGHSTGGTTALLTSETTDRFRAVFAFGPVGSPKAYGSSMGPWPFDTADPAEWRLRAPAYWLACVHTPTFVLEGDASPSNKVPVAWMRDHSTTVGALHWAIVPNKSHFSLLAPANEMVARKILADAGPTSAIEITPADVAALAAD